MKKRLLSFIILTLFLLSFSSSVNAFVLHEVMEKREIRGGVTYEHIKRLESYGWQDIHVIYADLKAPGVKLDVLKSKKGESYLENTYKMAQEYDAVAAINADFFASKRGENGRGSAVGVEIRDGELYSSNSADENMNTLFKTENNKQFFIDALEFDITLNTANGKSDKIRLINKYDDLTGIVMYTDDWAEKSVGSIGGIIEVSVDKNGQVLEKVTESEPIDIPEGGYVLSAHMAYNTFLLDFVNVGDTLSVDIKTTADIENIETAVGGGAVILKDGIVPTEFSHNISGRNPRSAVGIDKSGTVITLVALDGRREDAKGMTQAELGYLMADLGCYTALNLDGGGSTLMAIDNGKGNKEVVNTPSDNYYRSVTNSIGILSTAEKNSPVTSIKIKTKEKVFLNSSAEITVKGYDKYKREVPIDSSKLVFTSSGKISDGRFYPKGIGVSEISVKYKNFTDEYSIMVLDSPREMNFDTTKLSLNTGETYTPFLIGKDPDGNMAKINLKDTEISVKGDSITIQDDEITAEKAGSSIITAKFGGVTANMSVSVDGAENLSLPDNITLADIQNRSSDLYEDGAFRFAVFGNTRIFNTAFDRLIVNRSLYEMKKESEFQVFLGADLNEQAIQKATDNFLFARNYNCFGKDDNSFITLPNITGSMYKYDATVWTKFEDDIKNASQNVFIFLDRNYITTNDAEMQAFKRIVEDAANSGKNVYVFGGGFVNNYTIENGVRYINTAGVFPSISLEGTSVSYIKYVLVTVNGKDVTYEYKSVFGED